MNNENFTIDTKHMSRKQLLNVGRLIAKAGELDFPLDSAMTQIGYNTTYGNTIYGVRMYLIQYLLVILSQKSKLHIHVLMTVKKQNAIVLMMKKQ